MPTKLKVSQIPPLPPNKTAVDVYGDFMAYLMKCADTYIKDTHPQILDNWPTLRAKIEFIIAHPNGWEGSQQTRLRRAAVLASLIPDTPEGRSRISFISEGEASLHFCIGEGFVVDVRLFSFIVVFLVTNKALNTGPEEFPGCRPRWWYPGFQRIQTDIKQTIARNGIMCFKM